LSCSLIVAVGAGSAGMEPARQAGKPGVCRWAFLPMITHESVCAV
jgi:hypothetical protein